MSEDLKIGLGVLAGIIGLLFLLPVVMALFAKWTQFVFWMVS